MRLCPECRYPLIVSGEFNPASGAPFPRCSNPWQHQREDCPKCCAANGLQRVYTIAAGRRSTVQCLVCNHRWVPSFADPPA